MHVRGVEPAQIERRAAREQGRRASAAAMAAVPSRESSSTRIDSHAMAVSDEAACTRWTRAGTFAASRNVGPTMETAPGMSVSACVGRRRTATGDDRQDARPAREPGADACRS